MLLPGFLCMVHAQGTDYATYGVQKSMPTFFEQLKQQLTYPLAWGNSPVSLKNMHFFAIGKSYRLMSSKALPFFTGFHPSLPANTVSISYPFKSFN